MSNVFTRVSLVDQFIVSLYSVLTSFKTKLGSTALLYYYYILYSLYCSVLGRYRRVVDYASNGIGYKPSWQTISDVCAYKYAMHIYNNVYKTCIETFFTLVNTRIYLPENVSIHPSIVDRRR